MRKSLALILICLTPLVFAVSCSKHNDEQPLTFTYPSEAEGRSAFNNLRLECTEPGEACPEFVGGMSSFTAGYYRYSVGVCSITLLSSTKILTNYHCIPDDLKYEGADCRGRMMVTFPKIGDKPSLKQGCLKVESITTEYRGEGSEVGEDWAILNLEGSIDRTAAKINSEGVEHGDRLTIFPVYYNTDDIQQIYGQLKNNSCEASMLNKMTNGYFSKYAPALVATKCSESIIKGNSGSGIFNAQLELSGLGSRGLKDDLSDIKHNGKYTEVRQNFFIGQQIACNQAVTGKQANPLCDWSDSTSALEQRELVRQMQLRLKSPDFKLVRNEIHMKHNRQKGIQWSDDTQSLVSMIQKNKILERTYKAIGLNIRQEYLDYISNKLLPKQFIESPKCIERFNPPQTVDIYFVDIFDKDEGSLSRYADIIVPVKTKNYRLNLEDSPGESSFLATPQLIDDRLSLELIAKTLKIVKLSAACLKEKSRYFSFGTDCEELDNYTKEVDRWKAQNNIDDATLQNQDFTDAKGNPFVFKIPYCN